VIRFVRKERSVVIEIYLFFIYLGFPFVATGISGD
jgi:hypothetical protein